MVRIIYILSIIMAFTTACSHQPISVDTSSPQRHPDTSLIARSYPKVDGSTSTIPLHSLLACRIYNATCRWSTPAYSERNIVPVVEKSPPDIVKKLQSIRHSTTHGAYINIIEGKADLGLIARIPSEDELRVARKRGVELNVVPVAIDAFVFLVNVKNSIDDLTIDQIHDIYSGKIIDWSEIGGPEKPIKAYQRERNSGSQELMETLVMKGTPMIKANEMIAITMMGPVTAIRHNTYGIGYSVYYYANFMLPDKNSRMIAINGVKPTSINIKSRAYPLTADVYAVTRKGTPVDSPAMLYRDWILSEEGQKAVAESGYVPIR